MFISDDMAARTELDIDYYLIWVNSGYAAVEIETWLLGA